MFAPRPTGDIIPTVSSKRPRWLENWLARHQSPLSFWLHVLGIPLTIAAVVLAGCQLYWGQWALWWRPVVLLAAGYALQVIGHRHEGNTIGELIPLKRLLGRPYLAFSPKFDRRKKPDSPDLSVCRRDKGTNQAKPGSSRLSGRQESA